MKYCCEAWMQDDLKQACTTYIEEDVFINGGKDYDWYPEWKYCPMCGSELPESYWKRDDQEAQDEYIHDCVMNFLKDDATPDQIREYIDGLDGEGSSAHLTPEQLRAWVLEFDEEVQNERLL